VQRTAQVEEAIATMIARVVVLFEVDSGAGSAGISPSA
jgi:hypothetical protein